MNCAQADELLAAHALGALPDEEARQLEAHVRGCRKHDAALADLGGAARALALTAAEEPPPPALRSRLLASVAHTPQEASSRPVMIATAHVARPAAWPRVARRWGLAAAAGILVAGMLAWNLVLQAGDDTSFDELARSASSVTTLHNDDGRSGGFVVYYANRHEAVIFSAGMEPLDPSRATYQLWAIEAGTPRSLGLMSVDAERHGVQVVRVDASAADAIAVTVEPPGGSEQPTSDPIFSAPL